MGIFGKNEEYGLRLTGVREFNCSVTETLLKTLQAKLGFDDDFMGRIGKSFLKNFTCKIEFYEDASMWSFERAKVWTTIGDKTDYYEIEDPFQMPDRPFCIWSMKFWQLLTDEESERFDKVKSHGVVLELDEEMGFVFRIDGVARFEKETDSWVDLRLLKDKVTDEAILLQVKPYDFESLKEFDDANDGADFPDDPRYYLPTEYYRRWSNWKTKDARSKSKGSGFCWTLQVYDFTKKLPLK